MVHTVIVAGRRTPCANLRGALSSLTAPQLGAVALRAAIADADAANQSSIVQHIDEVILGCVLPAGVGQAPARQAARGAGLDDSIPAVTINKMCGSGMKTLMLADDAIRAGRIKLAVAGGMESMSRAPHLLAAVRGGARMGDMILTDHMFADGLRDAYNNELMGVFAQQTADNLSLSRADMDDYATESVRRACAVQKNGDDSDEIAPVTITLRRGEIVVEHDEQPPLSDPEKIRQLKPAFTKDGTITAANSSCISDGAAVLLLAEEAQAKKNNWPMLARIVAQSSHARAPQEFTIAPADAIDKVLSAANWRIDDVDLFEINEAFAVVTLAAMRTLNISHDKVNVRGGACAIGHPVGASGARIVITLLAALRARNLRRGIAAICIGGGEATAIAVELL